MIEIKWTPRTIEPNLLRFPITTCDISFEGTRQFNEIVEWCEQNIGPDFNMEFTKSTGIKKGKLLKRNMYGIRPSSNTAVIELIIWYNYRGARIQYRHTKYLGNDTPVMVSGRKAFEEFEKICKRHGVDLAEFAENDEKKAAANKQTIEPVKIEIDKKYIDVELHGVNHLDLNSSYLSGIGVAYPKLRPALDWMYEHRKDSPILKSVMVAATGYFQSEWCKYKYAHLSAAGIAWNNRQIERLAQELRASGRQIIGYNTDGIWYRGPVYHDEFEGSGLCHWKNDHINCKFRAKSDGAYEFVEDGKYTPVIRGTTRLDKIKSRDLWEWGDIYKEGGESIQFEWNPRTHRMVEAIMED